MTMPYLPPERDDDDDLTLISRCLHHWRTSDLTTMTVDGIPGTYTRNASVDLDTQDGGVFVGIGRHVPAWEHKQWPILGSIQTAMMARLSTADNFAFDVLWNPQAFGFYFEFYAAPMDTSGKALFSITNSAGNPARFVIDSTGAFFRIRHHNGTTEVTQSLAVAPVAGARVVMWGFLYADGSVQLFQQVNEGVPTFTARSAANAINPNWPSGAKIYYSTLGSTAGQSAWWRDSKLVPGLPTLLQLQRAF